MGGWRRLLQAAERFDTPWDGGDNRLGSIAYATSRRDSKLDDKLHSMLRDLRRALSEAISESSEINRTLRKIREEGYSLYLLVDCKREVEDPEARRPDRAALADLGRARLPDRRPRPELPEVDRHRPHAAAAPPPGQLTD